MKKIYEGKARDIYEIPKKSNSDNIEFDESCFLQEEHIIGSKEYKFSIFSDDPKVKKTRNKTK